MRALCSIGKRFFERIFKYNDFRQVKLYKQKALHLGEPTWLIMLSKSRHGNICREIFPPIHKLYFKVIALDSDGNTQNYVKFFIDGESIPMGQTCYASKPDVKFEEDLSVMLADAKKNDQMIQLETRMEFKRDDFGNLKYLVRAGAPNVLQTLEYYFDALTDKFVYFCLTLNFNISIIFLLPI